LAPGVLAPGVLAPGVLAPGRFGPRAFWPPGVRLLRQPNHPGLNIFCLVSGGVRRFAAEGAALRGLAVGETIAG
jgi:hypothetical protein